LIEFVQISERIFLSTPKAKKDTNVVNKKKCQQKRPELSLAFFYFTKSAGS
jgi:hypothetical protein